MRHLLTSILFPDCEEFWLPIVSAILSRDAHAKSLPYTGDVDERAPLLPLSASTLLDADTDMQKAERKAFPT
jgi:hypothetical protein